MLVAAIVLVGCGGDPKHAAEPLAAPTANPTEMLRHGVASSAPLRTFGVAVDATLQARFRPGSVSTLVSDAVREPLTVHGQGWVNGGAATVDADMTIPGLPSLAATVTKAGEGLYIDLLGTTYRVTSPRPFSPAGLPHALLGWVRSPTIVGRETVDGVPTTHIRGTISATRAVNDLASFVPSLLPTPTLRRALAHGVTPGSIDIWIGVEDTRPRRIAASVDYAKVPAIPTLISANLTFNMRLSFDRAPAEITAPDRWEPLSLDRLGVLARG